MVRVPESFDLKAVAPLLRAGITTYSPLPHWKAGPGQKVGVIGLGHMGGTSPMPSAPGRQ